jgi:hypothetical protein
MYTDKTSGWDFARRHKVQRPGTQQVPMLHATRLASMAGKTNGQARNGEPMTGATKE